jgi:hypothetical protein
MSDKKRTSISIDADVYQFLQQSEVSQSGLINELVREYKDNDKKQVAALELRHEHLIEEAETLEERAERKRQQAEEVMMLLQEKRQEEHEMLEDARDGLSGIDDHRLTEDNPAVENWAGKMDMTPKELLEQL